MTAVCYRSTWCAAAWMLVTATAQAVDLEGYSEPFRTINVAADETGTIDAVLVSEGQTVTPDQPLVRLNCDIHEALLAIAEQNMLAAGRLDAATADLNMRESRLEKFRSLRREGHARQEEVDRTAAEVKVAEANVRAAQEDLVARRLEHEKIKVQIARRTVRSPIAGFVTHLLKEKGEFVAPNSPEVLTVVQLDTLLANFTLTGPQARKLSLDQQIAVEFLESQASETGIVLFISPVTDAESGTVLVKLRVDNAAGRLRSGERCKIKLQE